MTQSCSAWSLIRIQPDTLIQAPGHYIRRSTDQVDISGCRSEKLPSPVAFPVPVNFFAHAKLAQKPGTVRQCRTPLQKPHAGCEQEEKGRGVGGGGGGGADSGSLRPHIPANSLQIVSDPLTAAGFRRQAPFDFLQHSQ